MASARPEPPNRPQVRGYTETPSLDQQRIEVPTLDEQLTAYETRQALLGEPEDVDPVTAQRVYVLVSIVVGMIAAGATGAATIAAIVLFL